MTFKILTRRLSLPLFAALLLSACGGSSLEITAPSETIELRVTAEVETGVNARHITVIPNDVAPWLSHIILIDDKGALYRTALDSGKATPLNAKAMDAIGLMREKAAGVVLALSEARNLSAMIESDDEGNLSPITVSTSINGLVRFCKSAKAPTDTVYGTLADGSAIAMGILVQDSQIIVSEIERLEGQANGACYADDTGVNFGPKETVEYSVLNFGGSSGLTVDNTGKAIWLTGKKAAAITITPGLSTPGLTKAAAVHATSDSLGGAFRDGAIIVADADAPRLVMISAGFAQRTLAPETIETAVD